MEPIDAVALPLTRGVKELLERLHEYANLEGPHGETTSAGFRRMLGYAILTIVAEYYRQNSAPKHVIEGLTAVAEGLENLTRGVAAPVLTPDRPQSRPPIRTEVEKVRAHIAAFVKVMTADENLKGSTKARVARELRAQLRPELDRIANTDQDAPEKFLMNLARTYTERVKDPIALWHYNYWIQKFSAAFAKVDAPRRGQLKKAVIADIKSHLKELPKADSG